MEQQESQEIVCNVCGSGDDEDYLLLCDGCDRAYHTYCMNACDCCGLNRYKFPKNYTIPDGDWKCKYCRDHIPTPQEGEAKHSLVFGWGDNTHSCLGDELETIAYDKPVELKEPESLNILDLSCGSSCSFICSNKNHIYSCGTSTELEMGHKDITHETLKHFRLVDFFTSEKITKGEGYVCNIICTKNSSYAVTTKGHVYSWGDNVYGQLGHQDMNNKAQPKKISAFREMKVGIRSLVTSGDHTLMISDDNQLYAMGNNQFGQLGIDSKLKMQIVPKLVKIPILPYKIAVGRSHTLCMDNDNHLYIWGLGTQYQLGIKPETTNLSSVLKPQLVLRTPTLFNYQICPQFPDHQKLIDIACGDYYSILLFENNIIMSFGVNTYGQLGHNNTSDQELPSYFTVQTDPEDTLTNVYCGNDFTIAKTKNGTLYCWGNNTNGQLGLGHRDKIVKPQKNTLISNVNLVACGDAHVLISKTITESTKLDPVDSSINTKRNLDIDHNNKKMKST